MHVFIILFVCLAVSPKNKRVKSKTSSVLRLFNSSVRPFVFHTVTVKQQMCHDCQVNSQRVIHHIVRRCTSWHREWTRFFVSAWFVDRQPIVRDTTRFNNVCIVCAHHDSARIVIQRASWQRASWLSAHRDKLRIVSYREFAFILFVSAWN